MSTPAKKEKVVCRPSHPHCVVGQHLHVSEMASGGPQKEPETQNPALTGAPKPKTQPPQELRNAKPETQVTQPVTVKNFASRCARSYVTAI